MTASTTQPPGVRVPRDRVDRSARPKLIGGHCATCGIAAYPKPRQCPGCLNALDDRPLSDMGTLYSYSIVHIGPAGRAVPYTVGYVDLPEDARVFAHIDETDESGLRPDLAVRLELREDEDGFRALWVPAPERGEGRA